MPSSATPKMYTLSLHDALPIYHHGYQRSRIGNSELVVAGATQHVDFSTPDQVPGFVFMGIAADGVRWCNHIPVDALLLRRLVIHRSEEHTSELQSRQYLVCRLLRPLRCTLFPYTTLFRSIITAISAAVLVIVSLW